MTSFVFAPLHQSHSFPLMSEFATTVLRKPYICTVGGMVSNTGSGNAGSKARVKSTQYSIPPRLSEGGPESEYPQSPLPVMPSQTFFDLVYSQFELLSNALIHPRTKTKKGEYYEDHDPTSKVKSIALYLPQENSKTGQLEFLPSAVFPSHPKSERVFIASDANSGKPPTVPPTLTQLPGFAHAETIIPTYPFITATTSAGGASALVGTPEEVLCDLRSGGETGDTTYTAISLPLFSGPQTIGVLLVWGQKETITNVDSDFDNDNQNCSSHVFTEKDMEQIRRIGETLAMALCMDADRINSKIRNEEFRVTIADNLHQVKNPVQALRTFTKLLKRNMAANGHHDAQLGTLVDHIHMQSNRVAENLIPIDQMIDTIQNSNDLISYQKLLAPIVQNSNNNAETSDFHPKLMPTSSYLVKLSSTTSQQNPSNLNSRKVHAIDDEQLQIAFLTDVLQPVISVSQAIASENGIEFTIYGMEDDNELPGVMIYPRALQEAVTNVLENAIKYVKLGKSGNWGVENIHPLIQVSLQPNDNTLMRGVTITIEDNGPGISLAERESVFQRGFRGVNARRSSSGSGIGLEYSRAMIDKMGGTLSLHQNSDCNVRGTMIKFVLFGKQ